MTSGQAETRYDLVVIGCGAAGLSAAIGCAAAARAAGRQANIVVLERAPRAERGGATRYTTAWFRITADRELDPAFVERMEVVSAGQADLDYCRVLAGETRATLEFLERNGVEVVYFEQPFPNRNTGGGLGMPTGGGKAIVDGLAAVVDGSPGMQILYETAALDLRLAPSGAVDGVRVQDPDGGERVLDTAAVVLACGGFEGNPEMLAEHLGDRGRELPPIVPTVRNNRGDGLRMAVAAGGATAGQFDRFHGEPVDPRSTKPDAVIYGFPYGIVVNSDAVRFCDEGRDSFDATFEAFAYEIWRRQEQAAYLIGDQTTLGIAGFDAINFSDQPPVTADSIEGLALKTGLDPDTLQRTVREYNAAVGPGEFNAHVFDGKATAGIQPPKSNWAFRIESPPYFGIPLTCAITFTFGGVRTDSRARVVTADGDPIPGLYAAGEVTGLYYNEYPVGTSVLRAVTFGRIAGAMAAAG